MTPVTLTYTVTPAQFQKLLAELRINGASIEDRVGSFLIKGVGVEAEVSYANPTLTVVIENKRFYETIGEISDTIKKHLGS